MGAGFNAELCVGAGNAVVGKAMDVELNVARSALDISTRSGAGWKEHIAGLAEWGLSCKQLWVPDEAAFELLEACIINATTIAVRLLDVTGATGHGWSGTALVTSMKRGEPLDGPLVVEMELKGTGALTRVDPV